MKKIVQLFFLLLTIEGIAQEDDKLPKITPPSPEAFAMTKYGDQTIDESSGMVTQNINLFNYEAGKLQLPVNLLYQGAGVKVDDVPTWVGINWTLQAGGVITRVVKDIPDEKAVQRVLLTNSDVDNYYMNSIDGTPTGQNFRNLVINDQIDTEADIYNFNFMGYSGSFFIDETNQARILNSKKELKIIFESNFDQNHTIKIITEDGIEFIFGGEGFLEKTTRRYVKDGSVTPNDTNEGVTAFYLKSINHPINGQINFEYTQDLGTKTIVTQKIQSEDYIEEIYNPFGCITVIPYMGGTTTVSSRIIDPKFLKKISSPNSSYVIEFNSEQVDNPYFKRVLRKILVKDIYSNTIFKSIDFTYNEPIPNNDNNFSRFFLTKVEFDNALITTHNNKKIEYRFEYDNPNSLPTKFSNSKDFLGYYNGIINPNGIPNNPQLNPTNTPNTFANKTPDFNYAKYGSLKKVIYPTKGYTVYEYEGAKAKKKIFKTINLHAWRNKLEYSLPDKLTDGIPQVNEDETIFGLPILPENQTVKIEIYLNATDTPTSIVPQQEKGYLRVYDITNGMNNTPFLVELVALPSPSPDIQGQQTVFANFSFNVNLLAGKNYKVEFEIYNENTPTPQTPMEARIKINYFDGYEIFDNTGVRIKRMTNYSSANKQDFIKRVYYRPANNLIESLSEIPYLENTIYVKSSKKIYNKFCLTTAPGRDAFIEVYVLYNIYNSESIDYSNIVNNGFYEVVTLSYGGDNFEKGGIQKTFKRYDPVSIFKIPTKQYPGVASPSVTGIFDLESFSSFSIPNPFNGELAAEDVLIKQGNIIMKQSSKVYEYKKTAIKQINNFVGINKASPIFFEYPVTMENTVTTLDGGVYKTSAFRNELAKVTEKIYKNPLDLSIVNDSLVDKLTIETNNFYNSDLIGIPSETIITNSQGENKKIKNYFPITSHLPFLSDATSDYYTNYVALKDKHILSKPVQVESYLGNQLLSKTRTLYKLWTNNSSPSYILPEIVQTSKGNADLEDRVVFSEYSGANPKIVSYKNGSKTKYLYNMDNQVIVKIENYVQGAGGMIDENYTPQNITPCVNSLGNVNVTTLYNYDPITKLLIEVKDPNCRSTYYIYDELHRLKQIKDDENNVIKEFDTNYRPN